MILYHGTSNRPKVLREGLLVDYCKRDLRHQPVLYLTNNQMVARSYGRVIAIQAEHLPRHKFVAQLGRPEAVWIGAYHDNIEPELLSKLDVIDQDHIAAFESAKITNQIGVDASSKTLWFRRS